MRKRTLRISGTEALPYLSALASEKRLAILELLGDDILNIQQISEELGLAQPTVTGHVQRLEEVGLIATSFRPGQRGTQKTCSSLFDEVILEVGLEDTDTFHFPERVKAKILWFARGFVEYTFPSTLPPGSITSRLDLSAEICSEVAGFDNHWASDITVWINDREIGTWTSPGDFGGERGRLNPSWWQDRYSQFGSLKNWSIDARGSYVDGVKLSNVSVKDLELDHGPIRVRIGNRPGARYAGGVTLFGDQFGNYQQDLVVRLTYDLPHRIDDDQPEFSVQEGGEEEELVPRVGR